MFIPTTLYKQKEIKTNKNKCVLLLMTIVEINANILEGSLKNYTCKKYINLSALSLSYCFVPFQSVF